MPTTRSIFLWFLLLLANPVHAGSEIWLLTVDRWGNPEHHLLTMHETPAIHGLLGTWPIQGQRDEEQLRFVATDDFGVAYRFEGVVVDDTILGSADFPDTSNSGPRARHTFKGIRLSIPTGPPQKLSYLPKKFSNLFTSDLPPAIVIRPGDVVATRTIDSGGVDENGSVVAMYGNPQTGPFFVVGAKPGDVLAVHLRCLRLNRDYADSLDGLARRATPLDLGALAEKLGNPVRWLLDRKSGTARLQDPPPFLKDYVLPVRPMLGGIGVAPDFGMAPQSAGDTGRWGGNLDFNQVVEGSTVYLPVFQPGALLFLGDGHALQGDGETTQWALETSLDVEFSVQVLPARPLATSRVETDDHIAVIGQAPSMDDAVRAATAGMIQWLEQDYGATLPEASLLLGTAAEYRIVTLAGRNAGVSLSLAKGVLKLTSPASDFRKTTIDTHPPVCAQARASSD